MKNYIALLLALLVFMSGCRKDAAAVWQDEPTLRTTGGTYSIIVAAPRDACEVAAPVGEKIYRHEAGEYEVRTCVLSAKNIQQAVQMLTGGRSNHVSILQLRKFDLPEYRFVWHDAKSGDICSVDMVMDGSDCYVVTVAIDETVCGKYQTLATEVFSTFGLFYDEGV